MSELNRIPIEVTLRVDDKVVKETLSRCGIVNRKRKILYPSCYLIEHDSKYYIFHFKELFAITRSNYYNNISDEDLKRKNSIIFCLKNWGLIDVDESLIEPHDMYVFVLSHDKKEEFTVSHKFNMAKINEYK